MTTSPRLFALCGNPKSGKSTVQGIMVDRYRIYPVDDGKVIRDFAIDKLGLDHNQVYSQEGKKQFVDVLGKTWQVRDILGTYGNHLEAMFGPFIFPMIAVRGLDPLKRYSFGSVRRNQGIFYKQQGGVIIGIRNPEAPPSQYEFDSFDETIVDYWIDNDPREGIEVLRAKVDAMMAVLQ